VLAILVNMNLAQDHIQYGTENRYMTGLCIFQKFRDPGTVVYTVFMHVLNDAAMACEQCDDPIQFAQLCSYCYTEIPFNMNNFDGPLGFTLTRFDCIRKFPHLND
jgi:hypothetical protein